MSITSILRKVTCKVTFSGAMQFVGTFAVVASTWYMALQLREMRRAQEAGQQLERVRTSLELIRRWNDPEMTEARKRFVNILGSGQLTSGHPGAHDVQAFLNFYEEMALSVQNRLADETICRQFFEGPVLKTYVGAKGLIESGDGYANLKALNLKWRRGARF